MRRVKRVVVGTKEPVSHDAGRVLLNCPGSELE